MPMSQSDKATRFRALHEAPGAFVDRVVARIAQLG